MTVLFFLSRLIEPSSVTDTSQAILGDEVFLFDDIKEKALLSVKEGTTSCTDALFNLQEYKDFIENFGRERGYLILFSFIPVSCAGPDSPVTFTVNQTIVSSSKNLQALYKINWPS